LIIQIREDKKEETVKETGLKTVHTMRRGEPGVNLHIKSMTISIQRGPKEKSKGLNDTHSVKIVWSAS
jgi:hypothetical protein